MDRHLSKTASVPAIRTFLAIALPEDDKSRLASLHQTFHIDPSMLAWVSPDLLHITVRFLGEVGQDRIEAVEGAARRTIVGLEPFSLSYRGIGVFPHIRAPRVVWIGLDDDAGMSALRVLFGLLEAELEIVGFPRENRSYSPHITLGRVRDRASAAEKRCIGDEVTRVQQMQVVAGRVEVRDLRVMRSDLGCGRPRYTELYRAIFHK